MFTNWEARVIKERRGNLTPCKTLISLMDFICSLTVNFLKKVLTLTKVSICVIKFEKKEYNRHIKLYIVLNFGLQYKAHIINCIFSLLHRSEFLVVKGDVNGVMGEQPSRMLYTISFR